MKYYLMSNRPTDYGNLVDGKRYGDFIWDASGQLWHKAEPAKKPAHSGRPRRAQVTAPAAPAQPVNDGSWMLALLEAQRQARDRAYHAAAEGQRKNYEFTRGQVDGSTDRALQEAYINKMISLKNLPQQLAAQGLSGGASETATAGLLNNYGSARNELEVERQQQLAALLNTYQQNMAQLEAQRATGAAADLARLMPQLSRLNAGNGPVTVTMTQGQDPQSQAEAAMRRLRRALGLEEEE